MFQVQELDGKGERTRSKRVSAVFKIDGKYPLRTICPTGREIYGFEGIRYSFLGEDSFTEETEEETAVRAAKQWGFDVEPRRRLRPEIEYQRTAAHFVLCDYLGSYYPVSDEMHYEKRPDKDPRILRLFSPDEALKNDQVKKNNKRVIEELEQL